MYIKDKNEIRQWAYKIIATQIYASRRGCTQVFSLSLNMVIIVMRTLKAIIFVRMDSNNKMWL